MIVAADPIVAPQHLTDVALHLHLRGSFDLLRDRVDEDHPTGDLQHPWHAVRVRSGKEIAVSDLLSGPPFSLPVYCPRYPATFVRNHHRVTTLVPYLSTYLFARWDAHDAYLWHALRSIPHLYGFLGNPAAPDPIPDANLTALRDLIGDDGERVADLELRRRRLPLDSLIVVNRGPFAAWTARVTSADSENIFVTVRINGVLGRDHDIKMPTEWCDRLPESGLGASLGTTARSGPSRSTSSRRLSKRRRERSAASVGHLLTSSFLA